MKKIFIGFLLATASVSSMAIVSMPDLSCSDANPTMRLPGHVLILGRVVMDQAGRMLLVFPQENGGEELSQIAIDNAGIIGSDEEASMAITRPTAVDSYVVAQVFLGEDENMAPMVTCISMPLPIARLNPVLYGDHYRWLTPDYFTKIYRFKRYRNWDWRGRWNDRFRKVREEYRDKGNLRRYHDEIRKNRPHNEHKRPIRFQKPMNEKKMDMIKKFPEKAQNIKPAVINRPEGSSPYKPAVQGNKKPIVLPNS